MRDRLNLNMIYDPTTAISRGESLFLEGRASIDARERPMTEEELKALVMRLCPENRAALLDFARNLVSREAASLFP